AGMADAFLAKYSATGVHIWSKRLGSTGNDVGLAVGTDPSGNVVVGGTFSGTVDFGGGPLTSAGMRDLFLAKYDAAGGFLWAQRFGGTGDDVLNDLAVDSMGDVAIAGKFQTTISLGGVILTSAGGDDAVAAKFSGSTGGHVWSKRFGAASGDIATGVAVDGANNVVVAGYFSGAVDFGGGTLSSLGVDVFVAKYAPSGAHLSSRKFGGADTQICDGVGAAANGAITLAGFFMGTIDFGTGLKTAAGGFDAFLAGVGP
ncbi:MAG TPA: nucleotide-binding protein, partial [Thermoanaerobaculia bacterium]|nr:nucleotide-binding protein [Thermoanaerobaculia bacterium]